jgi:D-alanyl-D-alanine carboxypeptidase/D-alanyl-D-alanine-endopeptidase (penicillin-binding protein 4)
VRQGARRVYERRPSDQLIPASNMKLLVAWAALARLGPQTQLVTEARAGQAPANGVVKGPLWVVGGGDPLVDTNDFASTFTKADLLPPSVEPRPHTAYEQLADRIRDAGVRQVAGGVVGDDTRYDGQRFIPTWKPAYAAAGEVGPMGALVVNDGFAQFAPRVVIAPSPAAHAATVLTSLLRARGVAVGAPPSQGKAPETTTVIASLPSLPVSRIVATMLRESDNNAAEGLVKELGARFGGQGTTAAGLSVVRSALQSAGFPVDQYAAVDGSGLDRTDRASCALLLDVLQSPQPGDAIAAGLPVAARTGTLGRRFVGTPAAGRLRAKTGSLEGVVSLSGIVDEQGGAPLAFSMLVNDVSRDAVGRALEDRVGVALARWPAAVATPDLAPVGG